MTIHVSMSKFNYLTIIAILAIFSLSSCKDREEKEVVRKQQEIKEDEVKQELSKQNKLPEKWRNPNCLHLRKLKIVGGTKACWNGSIEINNVPQEGCGGNCNEEEYIDVEIEDKAEIERIGKSTHVLPFVSKYGAMACGTGDWRWEVIERWAGAFKIDGDHIILKDDDTCFVSFTYNGMSHIGFEKVNKLQEVIHSLHPAGTHPCFRGNFPEVTGCKNNDYFPGDICDIYDENYKNKVNKLMDNILQGKVFVKNVDEVISRINEYFVDTVKKLDDFYKKSGCKSLFSNEEQLQEIIKILNQKEGRTEYKTGANWDAMYNCEEAHSGNIAILKKYADLFTNEG